MTSEVKGGGDISIYPNPTSASLRINSESKIQQIDVINASGRKIRSFNPGALTFEIDISTWTPGVYVIRVNGVDRKIVKM